MTAVDTAIVALYLGLMLAIGFWLASRIRRFKDYFLAGGRLTTPLLVCTLVSTYYELDVTFATSEIGYDSGVVAWFWFSRPYYLAIFAAAFLLARRLKRYPFLTLPDALEHAYGRGARVTGALACFVYSLPITAFGGLLALFEALGWGREWALAAMLGVCSAYTMAGGLWADAVTDTVQFVLMCVALAVAIPPALQMVGGFDFLARLPPSHLAPSGGASGWLLAAYAVSALTVFVEPAFYQRIFAARDPRQVTRALLIGIALWAAYDWGVTLIGLVARAAVESGILDSALEGRTALVTVCLQTLPIGLRGLFVAGILAAAMSSIDSYALLASANLVYDIWRPLSRRELSDRTLVRMTRLGVLVVMAAGVVVCLHFEKIKDAWVFMASVLTSVVFVPIMGLLFGRPTPRSGLAASCAGLAALVAFYGLVYAQGRYDEAEGSYVWMVGGYPVWREYAVLVALPLSAAAYALFRERRAG